MTHLIECEDGNVYEVTNLYDAKGCSVTDSAFAEAIVIKFAEDMWASAEVDGREVHRVQ